MLTFTLGTFAIALNRLLLISALALATFVGWRVAKRGGENPESALFSLFLMGMLAARIAFVALYWSHYRNDPWQIIDLRDGGFLAWPGVIVLLLAALYRGWRRPALRRPLGFGVVSGVAFWLLATLSLNIYEQGTRLPDIALRNAAGEKIKLSDYQGGPLVINLWATWCPPCRREMPVLENAQQQRPDPDVLVRQSGRKHAKRGDVPGNPGPEPEQRAVRPRRPSRSGRGFHGVTDYAVL